MKYYKLSCKETNPRHTTFGVYDPHGAYCGTLTLLTADVRIFVQESWSGIIFWNGLTPESALLDTLNPDEWNKLQYDCGCIISIRNRPYEFNGLPSWKYTNICAQHSARFKGAARR